MGVLSTLCELFKTKKSQKNGHETFGNAFMDVQEGSRKSKNDGRSKTFIKYMINGLFFGRAYFGRAYFARSW